MIVDLERVSPDIHRCRKRHYDIPKNTHRFLNLSCDLNRLDQLEREENRKRNEGIRMDLRDFDDGHFIFRIYFTAISIISVFSIRRSF